MYLLGDACVDYDTDYNGNDLIAFRNTFKTDSWQQCASACKNYNGCNFWTWLENPSANFIPRADRKKCLLKSAKQNVGTVRGAHSGAWNCGK